MGRSIILCELYFKSSYKLVHVILCFLINRLAFTHSCHICTGGPLFEVLLFTVLTTHGLKNRGIAQITRTPFYPNFRIKNDGFGIRGFQFLGSVTPTNSEGKL